MTVKELYEKAGVKSVLMIRSNINGLLICDDYKPDKYAEIGDMVVCSIQSKVSMVEKESEYHMYSYLCAYVVVKNDDDFTAYKIREKLDTLYKNLKAARERTICDQNIVMGNDYSQARYYQGRIDATASALVGLAWILEELEDGKID